MRRDFARMLGVRLVHAMRSKISVDNPTSWLAAIDRGDEQAKMQTKAGFSGLLSAIPGRDRRLAHARAGAGGAEGNRRKLRQTDRRG
jgi:hypothetical protein